MRLPRLLDGNMNELARLNPSRLSATVNLEPLSTATMVLPAGEPSVSVLQYVEIYKDDDSLGVYRVSSVRTAYGDSQEVSLEHGITVLEDCITPEDTELTGSFRSIISTLLGYQAVKRWQLGAVDVPAIESLTLTTSGDLCLQAVISLMEMVKGYGLFFDQTTSPWTLHVRRLETEPSCECRMSRNMSSVSITLDKSELVTRVVSSMLPGGYQDGPTVDEWGVIARPLSIDGEATEAEAMKQASEYLDTYKDPAITVEIDAVELSQLTGEGWDAFTSGKLCRTALPDFGVTVNERVNSLYYEDLLHAPQRVRLTLATAARTVQGVLSGINRAQRETTKIVHKNSVKIIKNEKDLLVQAEKLIAQAEDLILLARRVDVQAEEIQLKVSKNGVISAINLSPESVKISSDKIVLDGETIVQLLQGAVVNVTVLNADEADIPNLYGTNAEFNNLTVNGDGADWLDKTVVTRGRGVDSVGKQIINYLDHNGNPQSVGVVIDVSTYNLPTDTIHYLGSE